MCLRCQGYFHWQVQIVYPFNRSSQRNGNTKAFQLHHTHKKNNGKKKNPSVLTTMRWGGDNGLAESVCASVRETFPSSDGWESYSSDPHTICLCKEKQNRVKRTACHTRRRTKVHNFIHQNQAEKKKRIKKRSWILSTGIQICCNDTKMH